MSIEMIGVAALAVALVVMWRHRWEGSRLTVVLMLAGGVAIAAGGGLITQWLTALGGWLASMATTATSTAFGVGMPAIVAISAAVWVVVDLKDRSIHPATPWVALALPTVVMVTGATAIAGDWLASSGVTL